MKLVLDASAVLSWMLEDERDDLALEMAQQTLIYGASVPPLIASEVHNALAAAVARKRTTLQKVLELLAALARLPLRFEMQGLELGSSRVMETAQRCGLSAYDATYIVLAQELDAKLMTRDRRIRAAATKLSLLWEA